MAKPPFPLRRSTQPAPECSIGAVKVASVRARPHARPQHHRSSHINPGPKVPWSPECCLSDVRRRLVGVLPAIKAW